MVNYQTTGDSSYILDEYRKQNAAGKQTMDSLVNDSGNYGAKSKDQIKYINEQVQALERLNKIKYQTAQTKLQDARDTSFASIGDQIANRGLTGTAAQRYTTQKTKEINSDFRENSTLLREEFNEAKTQTSQLRSVVDTIRMTGKEEILSAKGNANVIADRIKILEKSTDPNDRAVASYMKAYAPEKPENKLSLFAQAVMGSMLNAAQKGIVQMAGSKNAYDMVRPAMSTAGGVGGTVVQGLLSIGGSFMGDVAGKKFTSTGGKIIQKLAGAGSKILSGGAEIGGKATETFFQVIGEEAARNMEAQQELERNVLKTRAITGKNLNVMDFSKMGMTYDDTALKQGEVAKTYGNTNNIQQRTKDVVSINKATGLDDSVLSEFITIQRNSDKSLQQTIGGILTQGEKTYFKNDRSFFNEFTQKFLGLQKEFMKSSTRVSDATTFDVMSIFDKVGGQFATNDPRGMSNLGSIQNAISNPQSDALKAMSYNVLRQLNPTMGFADLQVEMSKGTQSKGYLQAMMKSLDSVGGGEDYQRTMYSKVFGINPEASKELYTNREAVMSGVIRDGSLESNKSSGYFSSEAEENTNRQDSYFADIKNAFVKGIETGMEEISLNFVKVVKEAFGDATVIQLGNGVIQMKGAGKKVQATPIKLPGN